MLLSGTLLTSDKEKISYWHYKNGHGAVVIIVHGFYNSKDCLLLQRLAGKLSDEYDVFMFDFRGHGKSSGFFSWMSKESNEVETVLDHLEGAYQAKGIVAFSLGASISINTLAGRNDVQSLVCVSAPSEFEKIDYRLWEMDWSQDFFYTMLSAEGRIGKGIRPGPFWRKKDKPIERITGIKIPVFYIHGDKDWVIRPWHSEALFEKTRTRKKMAVIKGGPHAEYLMKDFSEELVADIKAWFKETIKGG
jgi:pimeloyl-ACP methyl ester carboxylesterase